MSGVVLIDNVGAAVSARAPHNAVVAAVNAATNETAVVILGIIFVAGHLRGRVVLAIALRRGRSVARAGAIVLGISQSLHLAAAVSGNDALDLVGWGLIAVGIGFASYAILRLSNDEWDIPPLGPRPSVATKDTCDANPGARTHGLVRSRLFSSP
ncbi:hypothetical protein CVV68_21270 [Arthrobacter livingstonensis]|uniref:Uncharacterized protein n=1 Tax=Arthrobacter livingstonensis TaxID=670078 RepID=A0A2V5L4Q2_9MICC|nr:hypothetical protein CVV68_21270 [Arthrobacter livingstonensis]